MIVAFLLFSQEDQSSRIATLQVKSTFQDVLEISVSEFYVSFRPEEKSFRPGEVFVARMLAKFI